MRDQGNTLAIEGLRQKVRIGCTEEERSYPQIVSLDIEMGLDMTDCIKSDELHETVDYMDVVAAIDRLSKECSWKLIESMCNTFAVELLAQFRRVSSITVRGRKFIIPNTSGITCTVSLDRKSSTK